MSRKPAEFTGPRRAVRGRMRTMTPAEHPISPERRRFRRQMAAFTAAPAVLALLGFLAALTIAPAAAGGAVACAILAVVTGTTGVVLDARW